MKRPVSAPADWGRRPRPYRSPRRPSASARARPHSPAQPVWGRGSLPATPRQPSDQTASSLPLGSAKWNRRPPGKLKISLTIVPPLPRTVSRVCSSARA